MKLYDSKFVHFEWSDKLDGKCCFVADNINKLIERVNGNDTTHHFLIVSKGNESYPFECGEDTSGNYRFAYYDPSYEVKYAYWEMGYDIYYKLKDKNCDWEKVSDNTNFLYVIDDPDYEFKIDDGFEELREAYKQGKTIQHMNLEGDWVDCDVPGFSANHSYRIKPEEKKVLQDEIEELEYKLTVQTEFHKGNTIYYRNKTSDDSEWHPFSKATAGKDYRFDFSTYQYMINKDKFITAKDLEEDKDISHKMRDTVQESLSNPDLYRPFEDTDELIAYWDKHYVNGNRPTYTMPLIWIKEKDGKSNYLITGMDDTCIHYEEIWIDLKELFEKCEFLDGRCCGKVKE